MDFQTIMTIYVIGGILFFFIVTTLHMRTLAPEDTWQSAFIYTPIWIGFLSFFWFLVIIVGLVGVGLEAIYPMMDKTMNKLLHKVRGDK